MKHHYRDIIERAGSPDWWDENGAPRYGAFAPDMTSDIYAAEAALCVVACQDCGATFRVCMSMTRWQVFKNNGRTLADMIADGTLHYGDPPNAGCCPAGPTMNSEMVRVMEYWVWVMSEATGWEWQRDAAREIVFDDSFDDYCPAARERSGGGE